MTLLFRDGLNSSGNFKLFWSYKQFISNLEMRKEILLNIALFLPLGYIVPLISENKKWLIWIIVLSAMIEISQLVFKLGFIEFDDIISNSLGGFIGFFIGFLIQKYLISKNDI